MLLWTVPLVQVPVELPVDAVGICNAIAFWFELHLDEETNLSTSPCSEKVGTHHNTVSTEHLLLIATHDCYGAEVKLQLHLCVARSCGLLLFLLLRLSYASKGSDRQISGMCGKTCSRAT